MKKFFAGILVLGLASAESAFALPCEKEYKQTYRLSAESILDREKADEALEWQDKLTACMDAYEQKNGKDAHEKLTLKLSEIKL